MLSSYELLGVAKHHIAQHDGMNVHARDLQ